MPEPKVSIHGTALRVALYAHASGAPCKNQDSQLTQLRQYAVARGFIVC